ncbi:DUF397 domain-containing protein [Kitasatospora sp. NPDC048239]|uniref:DUF397 domain-containing protein n=1 Tax=Kitasatospora sp. NPDC048239 TaxID=3364046 RepID=UPI0037129368
MKADESALKWVKSSYSSEEGGQCVEVALMGTAVHVRDSKDPAGPVLRVEPTDWAAFVRFASASQI